LPDQPPPPPPTKFHRFVITPDFGNFAGIDNLTFQLSLLVIKQPKVNDAYPLNQENHTKTDNITFEAVHPGTTGQVNWAATLYYATAVTVGQYTLADSFSYTLSATITRTYQIQSAAA
jgi:hypothetical protein